MLGSLTGLGESNYTKKSQRANTISILTIGGALIGGVFGFSIGYKSGEKIYIKERTGLSSSTTNYYKEGRYWIGVTIWADTRKPNLINTIETKRISQKLVISFLNNIPIYKHDTDSASKDSINKCHNYTTKIVFDRIFDSFNENEVKEMLKLFPEIEH